MLSWCCRADTNVHDIMKYIIIICNVVSLANNTVYQLKKTIMTHDRINNAMM